MMTPDADPDPEIETDLTDLQTQDCPSCCGTRRVADVRVGACVPCPRCVPRSRSARGSSPSPGDLERDLEIAIEDDGPVTTLAVDEISDWLGRLLRPVGGDGSFGGDDLADDGSSGAGEVELASTDWDGEGLLVHAVAWRGVGVTHMRCGEQPATPGVEASRGPVTCPGCSSALLADRAASERVTQRVIRVAPAQIWAIVEPEISSPENASRLSPIASLAVLASEYLEAERAFRRVEVSAMSLAGRSAHDQALERVAHAEASLRLAVSSARSAGQVDPARLWAPLAQHSWLAGPVDPIQPRVRVARWFRVKRWIRAASARLRGGWDPR